MTYDEFTESVADAEQIERRALDMVQKTAQLCAGRLRRSRVSVAILRDLKKELRDFDMTTGLWKER